MREGSFSKRAGLRSSTSHSSAGRAIIEALEARQLLSAADGEGYTPSQIITAYGYNQFHVGGQLATGQGQTIAIVAPFDDPNIQPDLTVFDTQFGIAAPPSFEVVNQTGGTTLPTADLQQSDDTAMAVEWTHALAPGANILLVETNGDDVTPTNFLAGVQYAAGASGVSVVEMSLASEPFFSDPNETFNEFPGETADDSIFTTPSGHQNDTFVAAAGDTGTGTLDFPANSPNVLSVGGTVLTTSNVNGDYASETAWPNSATGTSLYEAEPSYQSVAQSTGKRQVADVSFNAGNPSLNVNNDTQGFDVYNSYFPTATGWESLQGTTGGAAGWAALLALVNQGRVASSLPTLDGVSDTLPDLYQLYGAPNTVGYSDYTNYFHDITTGGATNGYDTLTGLGTPNIPNLAPYLTQIAAKGHGGGSGGSGGGSSGSGGASGSGSGSGLSGLKGLGHLPVTQNGGTSTGSHGSGSSSNSPPPEVLPPVLPAVSLNGQFLTGLPSEATAGESVALALQLTNSGSLGFSGAVNIMLTAVDANSTSTPLPTVKLHKIKISAGGTKVVRFHFKIPKHFTDGTYTITASGMAVTDNLVVLQPLVAGTVTITG